MKVLPAVIIGGLVLAGLVACGGTEQATPAPATRPVKVFLVEGGAAAAVRSFPGKVNASQRAELAFRVSGKLQEVLVKEGDLVQEGQVLARLDPTDYELVLEDRQARFDNSERNFKRGGELVKNGNISRLDFDRMEAEYRSATAALSQASKDLEYTILTAPFGGRIAQRGVENFEEVTARQTVIWLQNIDQLDIVIDLPESLVRSIRGDVSTDGTDGAGHIKPAPRATARFEGRGDQAFVLQPKEVSTRADPQTQTFRATLTMPAPTTFTVLPGMTATVSLDLSDLVSGNSVKWVPARAVQADSALDARVWLLDPVSMTVSSRKVSIGRLSGSMIEITDGLVGGEEIVAVGAPYLAEGMRVTRMAEREQAVPRAGDQS
ncbi:MAG: efflux RND transporter periplasmic adaptor subunit [Halioglobus sp.]|nr:efflux RND transporter periplasmic adaptor subunit [Halioglobus sp.]